MTWFDAERDVGDRKAQAAAAGANSRMMRELDEAETRQRRARRMKLLTYATNPLRRFRKSLFGNGDSSASEMAATIPDAGQSNG